ncbi:alpha-ketoglutarate-dependent dioxygenase AlkB [Marinicella meishanensis]|uniref:alpha-ketoglutarate-dependent dioxygenase AlkB n=1 Tax=Marinicella meishanensis TaxID=2873263 RepID=UPI001CC01EBD|nr:alpha-ketoglutarate-dependent dioxygenase AlkB [Marinicella sp. NBU2979]
MKDLFTDITAAIEEIHPDVYLLRDYADSPTLLPLIKAITEQAPFRFMHTPGGKRLHISMTNCGDVGWISDAQGYRYVGTDPTSNRPWPAMPQAFIELAQRAAALAQFHPFQPNACLINHYRMGQELTAHQDKNEPDLSQPIVSVSLGMSARFQVYGKSRSQRPLEVELYDGDVMVWGRSARLIYHGVKTQRSLPHPELGEHRINLTFRRV